jgi:hypothetical protein
VVFDFLAGSAVTGGEVDEVVAFGAVEAAEDALVDADVVATEEAVEVVEVWVCVKDSPMMVTV